MAPGRLDGKVALITGAGAGIGACTAELFAQEGATLVLNDLREDGIAALAEKITAAGGKAIAVTGNVTAREDVARVVAEAVAAYGRIDVLVNNAGISDKHSPAIRTSDELWDKVVSTNLTGVFYFCREVLPHMVAQGSGSIVNLGSIGGVYHCAGVAYSAAKAGVNGLTRNIALQYAGSGIRCNSVNPGPTSTSMISPEMFASGDQEMMRITGEHMYLAAGECEPIDQARAILFFASDESRYITGQWLVIDRGVCL